MHNQTKEIFFKAYDIFSLNLSVYAKAIYFYLCKCKNKDNQCFPSHYDISVKTSCSVSRVKTAIKELEQMSLIKKENRFFESKKGFSTQTSNLYTIYPYPQIQIDNDANITLETSTNVKVEPIVELNKSTGESPETYKSDEKFNNTKPIENKSINLSNNTQIIGKKNDKIDSLIPDINSIFEQCNLKSYFLPSQNIIKTCVINMYYSDTFAKKNKIPQSLVQERLRNLSMQIIDESLCKYSEAVESGLKIYSHNLYFEKILWNSIVSSGLDDYIANVS